MGFNYKALGKNIKKLRNQKGMTQAELAEAIDKSDSLIGQIENARGIPSLETVADIANALEVGIDRLVYGSLKSKEDYYIKEIIRRTKDFERDDMNLVMELFLSVVQVVEDQCNSKR